MGYRVFLILESLAERRRARTLGHGIDPGRTGVENGGQFIERHQDVIQGPGHFFGFRHDQVVGERIILKDDQRPFQEADRLLVLFDVVLDRKLMPVEHAGNEVPLALRFPLGAGAQRRQPFGRALLM
jgi:hypothetical protein